MDAKDESNKVDGAAGADGGAEPAGLPEVESPKLAPGQSGVSEHKVTTAVALFKGENVDPSSDTSSEHWWVRRLMTRKIPPIAAAIAVSLVVGGLAGMFSNFSGNDADSAQLAQSGAMKQTIAKLSAEVAALKAAQDSTAKTTGSQLTRITERIDRAERAQTEPTTRLSKLSETVDRLERRVASVAAPPATTAATPAPSTTIQQANSADVTGTISSSQPTSAYAKDLSRLPIISGWTLQRIEDGRAYIYSREGMIEVAVGNALPGGGRVESIRRQDGRWVVVTSRGIVLMR
ncbi:MAG: hypothetical protein ACXWKA_12760 [Xanthobacteraceae bacterium]